MNETIEYKGYEIRVEQDVLAESPREWGTLGTMYCFHSKYNLGDEVNMASQEAYELVNRKDQITLPLYLYDHSGITMRTTPFDCPWDSGQVGWITVSLAKVRDELDVKRVTKKVVARVKDILRAEVETYDGYLRGDVYGYEITKDGEFVDSGWGFIGDPEKSGLLDQAKDIINGMIEEVK